MITSALREAEAATRAICDRKDDSGMPSYKDILACDQWVYINIATGSRKKAKNAWTAARSKLDEALSEHAVIVMEHWLPKTKGETASRLAVGLLLRSGDFPTNSVILGPSVHAAEEATRFRSLWGEKLCELRRFPDGQIRESVALHNPWGPPFANSAAVIAHILRVHAGGESKISVEKVLKIHDVPVACYSHERLKEARAGLEAFSQLLAATADPKVPIRRIRGLCSCLNDGEHLDAHRTPAAIANIEKNSVVMEKDNCLLLKKSCNIAPSLTTAIPVMLDITHKKNMEPGLFNYLRVAFLVNLKKSLEAKAVKCMLKDNKLYCEFNGLLFCLDAEAPESVVASASSTDVPPVGVSPPVGVVVDPLNVHGQLQSIGMRFGAWAAASHCVKKWISSKMLDSVIPEVTVQLLLAHVFLHPVPSLAPPSSAESAVLRFLDFLSFHDFAREGVVVNLEELLDSPSVAAFQRRMSESRSSLPFLALLTPFDRTPCHFGRTVREADARRLVNLARQTLHALTSGKETFLDFDSLDSQGADLGIYDFVIHLKPLQIPQVKERKGAVSGTAFHVVDYNPVASYLSELKECFSDVAHFYYGNGSSVIGVKLEKNAVDQVPVESFKHSAGKFVVKNRLVCNIEAMVEDFRILGQDFVKEIECQIGGNRI